jgi:ribosomal protein S18 acetylase RimI-like enzyme
VTTEPTLRPARAEDAPAIAALHADSWRRHYRGAYSDSYLDGDVETERLAVWTTRLAGGGVPAETVVTVADETVVGFAHAIVDDDTRWGSLVENLHVSHDRQRDGLGRRLLQAVGTAAAGRSAAPAVYLWVLSQNTRAQRFYAAVGGECVEQTPCPPPGGVADRLTGSPTRLRFVWKDAADIGAY